MLKSPFERLSTRAVKEKAAYLYILPQSFSHADSWIPGFYVVVFVQGRAEGTRTIQLMRASFG